MSRRAHRRAIIGLVYDPWQLSLSNSSRWHRGSREIKVQSVFEQPAIAVSEIQINSYSYSYSYINAYNTLFLRISKDSTSWRYRYSTVQ